MINLHITATKLGKQSTDSPLIYCALTPCFVDVANGCSHRISKPEIKLNHDLQFVLYHHVLKCFYGLALVSTRDWDKSTPLCPLSCPEALLVFRSWAAVGRFGFGGPMEWLDFGCWSKAFYWMLVVSLEKTARQKEVY
ncbi:hypothetical protein TNCT_420821 [Trichonephila clavata]|uniref:Uncharacterized protein n=1 Tax=Trichonephila clavata TaxID=2740835 RepID=A0A8X6LV23_TRICU|nr:hypothetical protein TNCT_420821 [Trichonephila clavata]